MWAVLLAAALAATPVVDRPRVFALVIGNNRAVDPTTPELKFADDDAIAMHELLLEAGVSSVLLVDADAETAAVHPAASAAVAPTPAAVEHAWAKLKADLAAARAEGPTEFVFFFSGHGDMSGGEGYLALDGGRLTRSALQSMLAASPALRNHVVVDACKAYFAVLTRGPGGRREPYARPFVERRSAGERSGFLLSSSADGDSHEWERFQSGVFSFEVRSALRGGADINRDGVISYRELGGFLQRANAGVVNSRFRPDFLVIPPGARDGLDEPVLRWPAATSSLMVDGAANHFYVEASSGRRVLELHRAADVALDLRLPRERPLFIRSSDERAERVLERLEPTSLSSLPASQTGVLFKGALHVAFTQLFAQPFDPGAVHAFEVAARLEEAAPPPPRETVRTVSLVVAGAALAVGVTALGVGIERTSISPTTSQRERIERNAALPAVNTTMGLAGGIALAAVGTWVVLTLTQPSEEVTAAIAVSPSGASLTVRW